MPQVKDLMDILKNDFAPDDVIAYSLWTRKDVETLMEQENRNRRLQDHSEIYLEPEEIDDILESMHDQNDPDQGLNNDSMFSAYLDIIGDREEEEEEEEIGVF
jgi:hypothetical protein